MIRISIPEIPFRQPVMMIKVDRLLWHMHLLLLLRLSRSEHWSEMLLLLCTLTVLLWNRWLWSNCFVRLQRCE